MEQLQNLVSQYALSIRKLEDEEAAEALQLGDAYEPKSNKERARRITIRLQMAANRCTWVSSTEMAVYIKTKDAFWCTHFEQPLFLSRPMLMAQECKRLFHKDSQPVLTVSLVPIQSIEFQQPRVANTKEEGGNGAKDVNTPPSSSAVASRVAADSTRSKPRTGK